MPPGLFAPNTHFTIPNQTKKELKEGVLLKLRVVIPGEGPRTVTLKVDTFREDSVEYIAAAYTEVTTRFPRIRVLKGADKGRVVPLFYNAQVDPNDPYQFANDQRDSPEAYVFYLMEYMRGLTPLSAMIKDNDPRLRHVANHPETFIDLGKTFAVDLFFANNDRILRALGDGHDIKNWDDSAPWIVRTTNIFFYEDTFNAADFLSPNCGAFGNLHTSLSQQVAEMQTTQMLPVWPGKHLKRAVWEQTKQKMSWDIIQFLNITFANAENSSGARLGEPHRENLRRGLEQGRTALKAHLRGSRGRNTPIGIRTRMTALSW